MSLYADRDDFQDTLLSEKRQSAKDDTVCHVLVRKKGK